MGTGSRSGGEVRIGGKRIDGLSRWEMRPYRRQLQVVFQDPYSSLNPRLSSLVERLVDGKILQKGRFQAAGRPRTDRQVIDSWEPQSEIPGIM